MTGPPGSLSILIGTTVERVSERRAEVTTTIATTPQYPAANIAVRVDFTVTGGGNYLRGYYTDAPLGSEAKTALLGSGASRLPAFTTDSDKPWIFTPDVGGIYTFQVEQLSKGASDYGGGYEGSPDSFLSETVIDISIVTLTVGQFVTQQVGFGGDTATLTLFIHGSTIRATTFDRVGLTSPIISEPSSKKATTAMLNPAVLAAVSVLSDKTTTDALGDLSIVYNDLFARFNNHIGTGGGFHATLDTDNSLTHPYLSPTSPEGLKSSVCELLHRLDQHMRNDDGGSATTIGGTGSHPYHVNGYVDWDNAVFTVGVSDMHSSFVGLADAWRAFHGHNLDTRVHGPLIAQYNPSPLPLLLSVHELFLAELHKQSPVAPASVNPGVTQLVHGAGFEEA